MKAARSNLRDREVPVGRVRDSAGFYARFVKRSLDLVVASVALVALLVPSLLLAALIWMKLGRPILFTQVRPGRFGRPFRMFKFRTMTDARDGRGDLLPDADRLTPFGRFLRASSLDELPELWNVLVGDMSLVGPRPLLMEYLPLYSDVQRRRHEVRPGITGWAQVNGRNAISWEQKFSLDVWYVDHHSLLLDVRILYMTVLKVVRYEDISQSGHATAEKFRGTQL